MIDTYPTTGASETPWQRYLARERAARDMYLEVTHRASHEYLTGPWPDRAAYEVVEHQAWATYYAAGRDAWRTYTREVSPPPPPPLPTKYPDGLQPAFTPLNEFDQRQETYLAADPSRRDNP